MRPLRLLALGALLLFAACEQQVTEPIARLSSHSSLSLASLTETQITTNTAHQVEPAISGDRIVWQDQRNGNSDIYMFDLSTGTETQITSDPSNQLDAAISGDRIVWRDERNGNSDIYLFDLLTGAETPITTDAAFQVFPSISGERIVWQDHRNGNADIYLYDLSTGQETQITNDPGSQLVPAISGDRIVWYDESSGKSLIYRYDLSTGSTTRITSDPAGQFHPRISGNRIIWYDIRNGRVDVFLLDLSTGIETQITTGTNHLLEHDFLPAISGEWIVWTDLRNDNEDIYLFDLSTGTETQLTTDAAFQGIPAISGERIVWMDFRNGNFDIYGLIPPPSPDATPTGTDVTITPTDQTTGEPSPTTITFSEVTSAGVTTVTSGTLASTGEPLPPDAANFTLGEPPTYYDITTTATFSGTITVCIDYSGASFGSESLLKLLHYENGSWVDITTSLDTENKTICGTTSSLSPFVVAEQNVAPVVTSITLPTEPIAVNVAVPVTARFADENPGDAHTAAIDWGTATTAGSVTEPSGAAAGSVMGSHSYTVPGVYTIDVSVTDAGLTGSRSSTLDVPAYLVIYDPEGGFVTGGGWIDSQAGWCQLNTACAEVSGRASFGFVSRYRRGATAPDGNTQFQFHAGDLDFRSTAYEWLVIGGPKAQYKGEGTINGSGTYGFLLTANDGQVTGGGGVDRFRIKIWDIASGDVVYDNQPGDAEDAEANIGLGGGSIVIHRR